MSDLDPILEGSDEGEEEFLGFEEEENDYSVMIELQEMLTSLTEENFESSLEFFKGSPLYNNNDLQLLLVDEILSTFAIRPSNIKLLARFCCQIKTNESLEELFLSEFFRPEPDLRYIDNVITRSAFLRELLLQGFTKIEKIQEYIDFFMINFSGQIEQLFVTIMFIAPELEAKQGTQFSEFLKIFDIFSEKCRSPLVLSMYQQLQALRADNWKLLYECIEFAAPLGSVQAALKKDDVEMLKASKFSVNAHIDKTAFEVHPAAQCSLITLQYAALFGAEKCIDYIISQHPMILADESESDFQYSRTEAIYDGKDSPEYERSVAYALALIGGNERVISKFREMHFPTSLTHLYAAGYRLNYECSQDYATDDLFEAVRHNNLKSALECIEFANVKEGRENNMTPAHIAAIRGHSYLLQIVYSRLTMMSKEEGNEEEEQRGTQCPTDLFGRKPIHLAAIAGHFDVVQVLMTMGCDPDQHDNFGDTCLSLAAKYGHAAIVNILLQEGVNPNPKDHNSMTPLLLAASNGRANACEVLARNPEVDVKATGEFGVSALHIAVQNGYVNTFESLIKSGRFDINVKDMIGRTVFDMTPNEKVLSAIKKFVP